LFFWIFAWEEADRSGLNNLEPISNSLFGTPLALETVRRIDALFQVERTINGQSAERRKAVRQELTAPLVADLQAWMRTQRAKLSRSNGHGLHAQALERIYPLPQ
jgi:hypothetical protein